MKSILLVEDDPFLVEIYITKLKEEGFAVESVADGEECINKLEEKIPDLMLLDVVLPSVDGWEILRKVKKDERFKNMKVFVLSNLGQKEEIAKGMSLGADKFLIKSHYTPSEVIEEVKKALL